MPTLLTLFAILVTFLTGALTLRASVNNRHNTALYYQQFSARNAAESGAQLGTLTPNFTRQIGRCLVSVSTTGSLITSHAQCGSAQATEYGTLVTYTTSPTLPAHCTDGHGQDGVMNPHCQPSRRINSLQVRF